MVKELKGRKANSLLQGTAVWVQEAVRVLQVLLRNEGVAVRRGRLNRGKPLWVCLMVFCCHF